MLLSGNLREFSLPNILQLVDLSAKSGILTISRDEVWGRIFFRNGMICYAFSQPQHLPLGERLIRSGAISPSQLRQALAEQEKGVEGLRIGTILLRLGVLDRETLERAVREQIQDTAFDFFSWPEGEFEFAGDDEVVGEDILVEMQVENVIMEGCRRIDEWERYVERLGSMERIPRLAFDEEAADFAHVVLSREEWRALVHMDGRADINSVLGEAGLDRFHGAKIVHDLYMRGLIEVAEPIIQELGRTVTVGVRGPIDIYNEVFLNTLTDGDVVKQLRVELIGEQEVEIPLLAGQVSLLEGDQEAADLLVVTASASASDEAWRRVAGGSTAWVVLANANDLDSLRSTRFDLDFVRSLGDVPLVVATYVSMADEELAPDEIVSVLGLSSEVPVVPCCLRDRSSVENVVRFALREAAVPTR